MGFSDVAHCYFSLVLIFSFLDSIYRRSGEQGRIKLRFGAKEDSKPQGRRKEFTRYLEPLIRPGFGGYTGQGSESKGIFRNATLRIYTKWSLLDIRARGIFSCFLFSFFSFLFHFFFFLISFSKRRGVLLQDITDFLPPRF